MIKHELSRSYVYKDSGLDWIGKVPIHWIIRRVKDLALLQSGTSIISEQIDEEGPYPVYGGNGLRGYFSLYTNSGDHIIIGRQGALCGNINYANTKFWASEHAIVVYLNRNIVMKWYGNMLSIMNLNQYSLSAAQPGLAVDRIKRLLLPVPPLYEQQAISDYIYNKTIQIDRRIYLLTQKVDKYSQVEQSLINETVIRGLDKTVLLKDSGIEWLGKLPQHWTVCKLKDIAFYQEGPGIMSNDFQEFGVPLIRISGMKGSTVSLEGCNFLNPVKVSNKWAHFELKLDELVVSASATTGIVAKVSTEAVGAIPYTGLIRFKPRSKLYLDYLKWFLTANIYTYQIDLQKSGTTIQHYGPTHLGRILAILPPMVEQKAIADYLDTKTTHIDLIIKTINIQIDKLKELRKTLINDVVTGKIRVAVEEKGE